MNEQVGREVGELNHIRDTKLYEMSAVVHSQRKHPANSSLTVQYCRICIAVHMYVQVARAVSFRRLRCIRECIRECIRRCCRLLSRCPLCPVGLRDPGSCVRETYRHK